MTRIERVQRITRDWDLNGADFKALRDIAEDADRLQNMNNNLVDALILAQGELPSKSPLNQIIDAVLNNARKSK